MAGESSDYKSADIYNFYKDEVIDELLVDYKTFMRILELFNKKLIHEILYDSACIRLPYNLGELRVRKREGSVGDKRKMHPDWKSTKEMWKEKPHTKEQKKIVYHLNEHRKGFNYKILWDKRICKIKYQSIYYMKPTRSFSRELASILKNKFEIDYYS